MNEKDNQELNVTIGFNQKEGKRILRLKQKEVSLFITLCRTAPRGHGRYSRPILLFTAKRGKRWTNSAIIETKHIKKIIAWLKNPSNKLEIQGQKKYRRVGPYVAGTKMPRYVVVDRMKILLLCENNHVRISIVRKYGSRKRGKSKDVEQASIVITRKEDLEKVQFLLNKMISVSGRIALLPRKWNISNREKFFSF